MSSHGGVVRESWSVRDMKSKVSDRSIRILMYSICADNFLFFFSDMHRLMSMNMEL